MLINIMPNFIRSSAPEAAPSSDALFALEWDDGVADDWKHRSSSDPNANGAYFSFLGVGGDYPENGNSNLESVEISDDPLFTGTHKALRNHYNTVHTGTSTHVIYIKPFGEGSGPNVYWRTRVRFNTGWEFGSDQLKWCKTKGSSSEDHVSCNTWMQGTDGLIKQTVINTGDGEGQKNIYAFYDGVNPATSNDDINNEFGPGDTDINTGLEVDQWYWLEAEITGVAAGSSAGSFKIWIDGVIYLQIEDYPIIDITSADGLFQTLEFGGHVWENDDPSQDITLDFYKTEIYEQRPGVPPGL